MWALVALLVAVSVALTVSGAPVPKRNDYKPEKLTPADIAGKWVMEWGGSVNGWVDFNEDGSYTEQVNDGSSVTYYGFYSVEGGTILFTEWRHEATTDDRSGPRLYRMELVVSQWPKMSGKVTGGYGFDEAPPKADTHTKIYDRKRNAKP